MACAQALGQPKSTTLSLKKKKNNWHLLRLCFVLDSSLTHSPVLQSLATLRRYYGPFPGVKTEA